MKLQMAGSSPSLASVPMPLKPNVQRPQFGISKEEGEGLMKRLRVTSTLINGSRVARIPLFLLSMGGLYSLCKNHSKTIEKITVGPLTGSSIIILGAAVLFALVAVLFRKLGSNGQLTKTHHKKLREELESGQNADTFLDSLTPHSTVTITKFHKTGIYRGQETYEVRRLDDKTITVGKSDDSEVLDKMQDPIIFNRGDDIPYITKKGNFYYFLSTETEDNT